MHFILSTDSDYVLDFLHARYCRSHCFAFAHFVPRPPKIYAYASSLPLINMPPAYLFGRVCTTSSLRCRRVYEPYISGHSCVQARPPQTFFKCLTIVYKFAHIKKTCDNNHINSLTIPFLTYAAWIF